MTMQDRGATFKRQLMADVDELITKRLASISATVAAQDDGVAVSDLHRVLNFIGAGVTVTDEPASRRANIFIPGGASASSPVTFVSGAGLGKVFTLGSVPANWQTVGFDDSAWAASVAMTHDITSFYSLVAGAAWVNDANTNYGNGVQHDFLFRRTMTLPAGAITSASLEINVDDGILTGQLYLNGTQIGASLPAPGSRPAVAPTIVLPISTSLLVAGGANLLAGYVRSTGGDVAVSFKLSVTIGTASGNEVIVGAGGASTIQFSSISQAFKDLRVIFAGRCDATGQVQQVKIRFNNDSSAIYDWAQHNLTAGLAAGGDGGAASASAGVGHASAASALTNSASSFDLTIPDYARTIWHKSFESISAAMGDGTTGNVLTARFAGRWRSTAAITDITLFLPSGSFLQNSVARIYGLS